ncbi:hypothetical protein KR093_005521 [Drosophila rubida]|uniref:C2H2-type domain-containing protein n=1 Tax=Drosophila rubida TaxID=30044 RepID=A0AAD4K0Y8_9MUSC|nr:hypothetical protein KR093_005521 [Drosophila rubida]
MESEITRRIPLTVAQLEEILSKIPVACVKPTDPQCCTRDRPVFQKLGVLVDLDEITDAAANLKDKQQTSGKINAKTAQSQSYSCIQCRRQLPTAHLLDIHITEQHDLYFAASVERGDKPMFACYIEECTVKFPGPKERKDHCISVHKFPSNYRFDQGKAKNKGPKQKLASDPMEVDNASSSSTDGQLPYIKAFSFGHLTQRTFNTRKESNPGKALSDVQAMKDALEEMN